MTEKRMQYLKYCPVHERFCREELRIIAKEIKDLKRELGWQIMIYNDMSVVKNKEYYKSLMQVTKALLAMAQAKYRAVKKLLPKRKQVKK